MNMGFIDVVMFNPVIISKSGMYETEEGCLSLDVFQDNQIPGRRSIMILTGKNNDRNCPLTARSVSMNVIIYQERLYNCEFDSCAGRCGMISQNAHSQVCKWPDERRMLCCWRQRITGTGNSSLSAIV